MGKSVFSLVLSDEIVAEIDRLAAREGCSRSALVNHILGGYTSLATPRQTAREILAAAEAAAGGSGLRASLSSGGTLVLRTALQYKYNPSISYMVELYEESDALGQLRVALRSQNTVLLAHMHRFFALWDALEERHLASPPGGAGKSLEEKRYLRALRRPAGAEGEALGEAIAAYISLLDDCLKTYVSGLENPAAAARAAEAAYARQLPGLGSAAGL